VVASTMSDTLILLLATFLAIGGIFLIGTFTDPRVPGFFTVLLGGVLFSAYLYWYLLWFHRRPRSL